MLRDSKLRFDRLSPIARLATVGSVLLCGLLVAGLRGPSGPTPALADDLAKPAAADDSIDTTYMVEDASAIVVIRPAAVPARPELAAWAKVLETLRPMVLKGTHWADFRQVTVMLPEADITSGHRELKVFQWVKPVDEAYFNKYLTDDRYMVKEYHGKKMYVRPGGGRVFLQYDDHTVIQAGSEQVMGVYLAGKRGVLPKWLPAKAWDSFQRDHWVIAANTAMMHREMKGVVERSSPMVRAAFASVSPVWEDATALAAGARLDNRLAVHAWASAKDTDSSEKLLRTVEALKTLVPSAIKNTRTTVQSGQRLDRAIILVMLGVADGLLENLKLQQEGSEVRLETSAVIDKAQIDGLLSPIAAARYNAQRMQATNNMKMLALAMHNYAHANRCFPPAVLYGSDGKTPYSWRVALLPYLEKGALYTQYHFDEPWDGPNNRKLLDKMPAVFRSPNEPAESKNALYFVLTGPGTIFDGKEGTTMMQITDGTSNTILAVEAKRDIPWTKPEDIPYDPDKPLPKLGGYFEGGFNAAMADGAVRFLSSTASEKILRLLITKADRQPVRVEDAKPSAQPIQPPAGSKPTAAETRESKTTTDAIRVRVVGPDGKPMEGVKVHSGIWTKEPFKHNRDYVTNSQGQATVELPRTLEILRLWARADEYVPLFAHWEGHPWPGGEEMLPIPEEFTFKLEKGTTIGGIVKNEDGQPISGVKVEAMYQRDRSEGEPQDKQIINIWLAEGDDACTTDAQGRWTLNNVPKGNDINLAAKVTHPDYVSDQSWRRLPYEENAVTRDTAVPSGEASLTLLRKQGSTIVMHRGFFLTGTVLDPHGKPVAGAVVAWGKDPYGETSGVVYRHEVRTDAQGIYRFPALPPGVMRVTVMAEGCAPDMRMINIAPNSPKLDFQLKAGRMLRIRFVDGSGEPIPEVGVQIEGWRGGKSLYNIKHPIVLDTKIPNMADKNGIYQWTWAPDDEVLYNYGKEGYGESRSQPFTANGTEHEIRLSR